MLRFAKSVVGKPFSNSGMARSIVYPRQTTGESFFCAGALPRDPVLAHPSTIPTPCCAELVAAVLKQGGLLSSESNPGAATPESLHKMYKNRAAAAANPYVLRDVSSVQGLRGLFDASASVKERQVLLQTSQIAAQSRGPSFRPEAQVGPFKVVSQRRPATFTANGIGLGTGIQLSLTSLDMRK